MTLDRHIYRAAETVIRLYGQEAAHHASARADDHLVIGDAHGEHIWRRIRVAIVALQSDLPNVNETVH